jgi:hypothetical protein
VHPLLVGAFPVLFLFAQNVSEQFTLGPLWLPLVLVVGAAALVLLVALGLARALGASLERATMTASLLIALMLTYGHAWNLVGESVRLHRYLLAAWALIAVVGLVLAWRAPTAAVRRATVGLTLALAALIVVNLVPIAGLALRSVAVASPSEDPSGATAEPAAGSARDVWYIVPDRYGGADGLRETYGFDNTPFIDALRERGFEVAEHATATYLKTALSLVSTLNLEELDVEALEAEATGGDDFGPIHRRVADSNAVERFLHERGYRYLHVGSIRGPTAGNAAADETFLYSHATEFGSVLADTTLLRALERVAPRAFVPGMAELYAGQIEFQLNVLNDLVDEPGPNFVFAHLLVPHPPYAFNEDGSRVTDAQRAARTAEEQFVEQVRFTNARLLALVDRLQAGPPESWPIIVIAADEGPFPDRYAADEASFQWSEARPDELLRKFSVLAAISVPGVDREALEAAGFSDDLTLVNLFRIVFNAAFDTDLPMLPHRNWVFVDQRHIYDVVEVTDRVPT